MTSQTYTDDFNEVKAVGSATSTVRTTSQTETALFIAGSTFPLATSSLRDLAARYQLDISDSARLFAAVDMSAADAVITSWDSKFEFGLWRPVTAIQLADTDGNPDTQPDHGLAPAGSNSAIPRVHERSHHDHGRNDPRLERSSRTRGRGDDDGDRDDAGGRIDVNITVGVATRHYEFASQLNRDAIDARVWSGIHFRTADVVGSKTGTQVGDWALDNYFQPTREGPRDDDDTDDEHP